MSLGSGDSKWAEFFAEMVVYNVLPTVQKLSGAVHCGDGGGGAWTTDDVVDRDQPHDRGSLPWGGRATALEGRASGFVGRGESRTGWRSDGPHPCRSIHHGQ